MKDHHKDKAHPKPHGGGMPAFEKDHWEKKVSDISVADGKYSSEMNQMEEYKSSVDALSSYAKKHKMKY
jgi:hypothetical protein